MCVFNTRALVQGRVSRGACLIDTKRGMCVFDMRVLGALTARVCSIGTMPHGANRYTPVDF